MKDASYKFRAIKSSNCLHYRYRIMKEKEKGIPCKLNTHTKMCIPQKKKKTKTDVMVWMKNALRDSSIGTWTLVGATIWGEGWSLDGSSVLLRGSFESLDPFPTAYLLFLLWVCMSIYDLSVCCSDDLLLYLFQHFRQIDLRQIKAIISNNII